MSVREQDPALHKILDAERRRQLEGVELIPSENYVSEAVLEAMGTIFTNKYSEGYPGRRYYGGGHLTHGWSVSITGTYFKSIPYHVKADGYIDFDEVWRLAREHRPRLIWCGATAYGRESPFEESAAVADEVDAYFAADIAHIAGLVLAGAHKSPVPYAHIITTTTHKTLRGPRGAMIMVTERGLAKDPELDQRIDRAVFPGLQGGPHDHTTAAIAVALG